MPKPLMVIKIVFTLPVGNPQLLASKKFRLVLEDEIVKLVSSGLLPVSIHCGFIPSENVMEVSLLLPIRKEWILTNAPDIDIV